MKKAIVVSTQPTKFDAVAFKGDLEANLARVARLGYDGVELAIRDPRMVDADGIVDLARRYGLEIPAIGTGQAVLRYGQPIGLARRAIAAGEHVHTHNLGLGLPGQEVAVTGSQAPGRTLAAGKGSTFLGYKRADGRVGTRNYVAVISTVNCSAHVTRRIAHHFTAEHLAAYPHIDGVVAFSHASGCTLRPRSREMTLLQEAPPRNFLNSGSSTASILNVNSAQPAPCRLRSFSLSASSPLVTIHVRIPLRFARSTNPAHSW